MAFLAALAAACLVSVGHAANLGFLLDAPAGAFNDRDWALLNEAALDTLDNAEDGDTRTWKNEENGHNGRLTPTRTYQKYGTTCRSVRVFNEAGSFHATQMRDLCKDTEGQWKILK
jgi:surface antigen